MQNSAKINTFFCISIKLFVNVVVHHPILLHLLSMQYHSFLVYISCIHFIIYAYVYHNLFMHVAYVTNV